MTKRVHAADAAFEKAAPAFVDVGEDRYFGGIQSRTEGFLLDFDDSGEEVAVVFDGLEAEGLNPKTGFYLFHAQAVRRKA